MKLIKLSDTHYIVVDDSEIKEGDLCYDPEGSPGYNNIKYVVKCLRTAPDSYWNKCCKKITHSTQPLEDYTRADGKIIKVYVQIKPLSLSEVEEALYGYSVEKMSEDYTNKWCGKRRVDTYIHEAFKAGFKAHQQLVKDKLFVDRTNIKFLQDLVDEGYDPYDSTHHLQVQRVLKTVEVFIQSILPKTEWNIEFDEQGKIKYICL